MQKPILLALITIVTLIALACGADGESEPTSTPPPATPTSPPEAPTPTPGEVTLPIEPAPGALTKVTYAPGEEIEGIRPDPSGFRGPDGAVFFMGTETGEIEGWYLADGDFDWSFCGVRDDNRFIVCSSGIGENSTAYLLDRESGEVYRWNPDEIGLLATWPVGLLFEEFTPGTIGAEPTRHFTITDLALRTRSTFDLPNATNRNIPASIFLTPNAVLPDESGLVLLVDRSLYLVDIDSGSAQLISEIPQTFVLTTIQVTPGTEGFTVVTRLSGQREKNSTEPVRVLSPHILVRRYSAEGQMISEWSLDGVNVRFSPDGRLVTWEDSLHWEPVLDPGDAFHWPVVVVADADTFEPRLRVRGAALCYGDSGPNGLRSGRRWLADSSGILVATKSGFRIVEVAEPALRLAPLSGVGQFVYFFEPSPDDPDLFAVGIDDVSDLVLVDSQGNSLLEVVLAPSAGGLSDSSPWGSSGNGVQFSTPHFGHHGAGGCGVGVTPPPQIEFPPFDEDIHLKVAADGDCLNLREATTATVITCLPDGTFLTVTEVESGPYLVTAGGGVAHVRTDAGLEGWVSSEFLDWAD